MSLSGRRGVALVSRSKERPRPVKVLDATEAFSRRWKTGSATVTEGAGLQTLLLPSILPEQAAVRSEGGREARCTPRRAGDDDLGGRRTAPAIFSAVSCPIGRRRAARVSVHAPSSTSEHDFRRSRSLDGAHSGWRSRRPRSPLLDLRADRCYQGGPLSQCCMLCLASAFRSSLRLV